MANRESLIEILKIDTPTITFTKKNGEPRTMVCTLKEELLPKRKVAESTDKKPVNEDVICVYDLELKEWRSFRVDSVIKIAIE